MRSVDRPHCVGDGRERGVDVGAVQMPELPQRFFGCCALSAAIISASSVLASDAQPFSHFPVTAKAEAPLDELLPVLRPRSTGSLRGVTVLFSQIELVVVEHPESRRGLDVP